MKKLALKLLLTSMVIVGIAQAECGAVAGLHKQSFHLNNGATQFLLDADQDVSIVGFWDVNFIAKGNAGGPPDGTPIDHAFAQWHSDGTEIMNSSRPPITSSFCLGVWKRTGERKYRLNHFAISWNDNSTLLGPANIREEVQLADDGQSFTGSFVIEQYDTSGNLLGGVKGELVGKRIHVNTTVNQVL